MKKKKSYKAIIIFIWVIGVICGILVNRLITPPYFVIENRVNLIHLLSILSPIAVAMYLNVILSRNHEKKSHIKKIFVEKFDYVEKLLDDLSKYIANTPFDFYQLVGMASQIRLCLKQLEKHEMINNDELDQYYKEFMLTIDELTTTSENISIIKGKVEINSMALSSATNELSELKENIFCKKLSIINEQ